MIELIQDYLIISAIIYFFPTMLSLFRGNKFWPVFVMNLFLGWTFIGWVWALVWAVSPKRREQIVVNNHVANETARPDIQQRQAMVVEQTDKTTLLNQLEQLHSLKEKSVITDDIYEQQKTEILLKLQGTQSYQPDSVVESVAEEVPTSIIQQENLDPTHQQLFNRKKWYQKPIFWIIGVGLVIASFTIWFLKGDSGSFLSDPFSTKLKQSSDSNLSPDVNFLVKFKDKSPHEVNLFDNPIIKNRLIKLIGSRYSYVKETWGVGEPIKVENNTFIASECQKHNCYRRKYIIVVDLLKNIMYVGIKEDDSIKTYSEDGSNSTYLKEWEPNN